MSGVIFGTKVMNEPRTEEQKTVKLLVGLIVIGIVLLTLFCFLCQEIVVVISPVVAHLRRVTAEL